MISGVYLGLWLYVVVILCYGFDIGLRFALFGGLMVTLLRVVCVLWVVAFTVDGGYAVGVSFFVFGFCL